MGWALVSTITRRHAASVGPGLALTALIALVAFAANRLPGVELFNPMVLALGIGIAWRNLAGVSPRFIEGMAFAQKAVLRFAIALLGLQVTAGDILTIGLAGIAIVVFSLAATFAVTLWLGARMGVDRKLAELLAAGTSICGASAIVAANAVTRARDEDVAYAVACITLCGTAAIFLFPVLSPLLGLSEREYGFWAGASIHEIAQVIAAAYQGGDAAGAHATIVKLTRVLMLGPLILALGYAIRRRRDALPGQERAPVHFPWFIAGFLVLAGVNSFDLIPAPAIGALKTTTTFLLSIALSAFGLGVAFALVRAAGSRPFVLCAASSVFIAALSLALIELAG